MLDANVMVVGEADVLTIIVGAYYSPQVCKCMGVPLTLEIFQLVFECIAGLLAWQT